MKPQQEQIKTAVRAYIFPLNPDTKSATKRFSVYLDNGNGLEILWPSDSNSQEKSKELLPSQKYSKDEKYPVFHFKLSGCGFSKTHEIRQELQEVNPQIEVLTLHGWSLSPL